VRYTILALLVCLLASVAASSALADDSSLLRPLSAQADEPWVQCSGQEYVRYGAPTLNTAPRQSWHVTLAAYLWATDISGTSYADGVPTDIDIAFDDLFDKLESAFMGYVEVQYKRWSFAVDASVVNLKNDVAGPVGFVSGDVTLDQTIVDLRLGYTALCRQVGSSQWGSCCYPRFMTLDGVVGARNWSFDQELTLNRPTTGTPVSVSTDESWWDPYVGARWRWQFAKRWGFSLYGDIGGFGIEDASELTWQIQAMVRFHITRGLFVAAGYRALDVDRVEGSGASQNGIDATYHGPVIGVGYRF